MTTIGVRVISTIIIIGGGPKPNARIVSVSEVGVTSVSDECTFEIRDGSDVLATGFRKLAHAQAMLPFIQSGD